MGRTILVLVFAIIFNAVANIFIKMGMIRVGHMETAVSFIKKILAQPMFFAGIFSFGLALLLYSMVLTTLKLSIAYPIMVSMGLIIVVLVSYFFLKETIHPIQIVGFLLIIVGVWMVAR